MPARYLLLLFSICLASLAADKAPDSQPAREAVTLNAADATLHGAVMKLTYAKQPEICYWTDAAAYVQWPVKIPRPGTYDVQLVTAAEEGQGGKFILSIGHRDLPAKTHPTGGSHKYKLVSLGALQLAAGDATLTIRPSGEIRGSLMNLRAVRLVATE